MVRPLWVEGRVQGLDGGIALTVNPDLVGVNRIGEEIRFFSNPVASPTSAMRASVQNCNQTEEQNKQTRVKGDNHV